MVGVLATLVNFSASPLGALLSGVMAISLHGWVFALGLVAGA